MTELKPCPFCGSDDVRPFPADDMCLYIKCGNCMAEGPKEQYENARWNTHPTEWQGWVSYLDGLPPDDGTDYVIRQTSAGKAYWFALPPLPTPPETDDE